MAPENQRSLVIIPGDGIGPEIIEQAGRAVEWFDITHRQLGVSVYRQHGTLLMDETLAELEREELSYHAAGSPLLVSKLSRRGAWFILDGHHRAIEAIRRGDTVIDIAWSADVPNIEHGGGYRDMLEAMVNLVDYVAERSQ